MLTLRPYQTDCARCCVEFLREPTIEHGLCIAPTGSGKSLIIAEVARQLDGPCVIFQPSREILQQNYAKLRSYGEWPAIFSASMGEKRIDKITLATHPGKPHALIVDMVGLVEQFGRVEDMVLHPNGGKWCYTSGDRQLTNEYYGRLPDRTRVGGGLIPTLDWKDSPGGLRTAPATGAFWGVWRERKEEIKAAGIFVRKVGEEYVVCSTRFK